MKRLLGLAAVLLVAVACHPFRAALYEDDLVLPLGENQADTLFFSVSLEYATKGLTPEVMDQMNSTILTQAFDLEDAPGTVEETAIRYRENLIDEYLTENSGPGKEGILTWEDHLEGCFTENYKQWKNYLLSYYSFRGGAHGIQTLSQIVFDKNTGIALTEADLFADGYTQPVAALMQEQVRNSMEADDPELAELVELESIVPNGNFSVGKDGILWLFQPYEAGPYALGIVTAALSWEQVKPYLR